MSSDECRLPPGSPGPGTIESFVGAEERELRYRIVEANDPRHHLLYFHGIESHGTWFLPAAYALAAAGVTTYLLDRRGSGLNRAPSPGDAGSAAVLLEDIARFRDRLGDPPLHLCGLSWGGKLATAAALARPRTTRSLVLVTPGLVAQVDLRFGQKLALVLGLAFGGRNRLAVPIEATMFTTTPRYLDFIRNDPFRLHDVTGRFLAAGLALDRRIRRGIAQLDLPVLLFLAGGERIVDNDGVRRLLAGLPKGRLRERFYPEATHSLQFDQREELVSDILHHLDGSERPC